MDFLERILSQPPGGKFRELDTVNTFFTPKDISLYGRLLPAPLGMPAHPTVVAYVSQIYIVRLPTHYGEWSVLLLSSYQGREAWYPLTMPVTRWWPMWGGRQWGFPKYIVDTIALSSEGGKVSGRASYQGKLQLELSFDAGLSRPLEPWEQALSGRSWVDMGFHCLVPPGEGPRLNHVAFKDVVPPRHDIEPGMVTLRVDPAASWAGLIPEGATPGYHHRFSGGANMQVERLA